MRAVFVMKTLSVCVSLCFLIRETLAQDGGGSTLTIDGTAMKLGVPESMILIDEIAEVRQHYSTIEPDPIERDKYVATELSTYHNMLEHLPGSVIEYTIFNGDRDIASRDPAKAPQNLDAEKITREYVPTRILPCGFTSYGPHMEIRVHERTFFMLTTNRQRPYLYVPMQPPHPNQEDPYNHLIPKSARPHVLSTCYGRGPDNTYSPTAFCNGCFWTYPHDSLMVIWPNTESREWKTPDMRLSFKCKYVEQIPCDNTCSNGEVRDIF